MKQRRLAPPPKGVPIACGMCGKAIIFGLTINGKPANQSMTVIGGIDLAAVGPRAKDMVALGRIHIDKRVCEALKKVTYEELERPRRPALPEVQGRGDDHNEAGSPLHPVGDVGVDQAGDGR